MAEEITNLAQARAARAAERKELAREKEADEQKLLFKLKKKNWKDKTNDFWNPIPAGGVAVHLSPILREALKKAPKLVHDRETFGRRLWNFDYYCKGALADYGCRLRDWKPEGKGAKAHFQSLVKSVLVTYPMPAFTFTAFHTPDHREAQQHIKLFHLLASGKSLFKLAGTEDFPPPLTRQMCHEMLTRTPSNFSIPAAVRQAQGKVFGGEERLIRALSSSRALKELHTPEKEAFWQTVIQWFCTHAQFFNPSMVGPVLDYLLHRFEADPNYSMKGRTPNALFRDMNAWHRQIGYERIEEAEYDLSGFKPAIWETKHPHTDLLLNVWTMTEILSSKELVAEGKALRHCVATYAGLITSHRVSIWSLREGGIRKGTIEVNNHTKTVSQARGMLNRSLNNDEKKYLKLWAQDNNITLGRLM